MTSMVVMKVRRLVSDPFTNLPSLVLEDASGREQLELAIGIHEAPAIASELSNVELDRPLPHDLIKTILGECGAVVERIELSDLKAGTFYAALVLRLPGGAQVALDCRPSDAIGLALRTGAGIHVSRKLLERVRRQERRRRRGEETAEERAVAAEVGAWLLESIPDEDFGKWKM